MHRLTFSGPSRTSIYVSANLAEQSESTLHRQETVRTDRVRAVAWVGKQQLANGSDHIVGIVSR